MSALSFKSRPSSPRLPPFPAFIQTERHREENAPPLLVTMKHESVVEAPATKPKPKRFVTAKRREQCRHNQARYRDRQRGYVRELHDQALQLRQEVQTLSIKRYSLCYGAATKKSVWHIVVEYFRLFRYGYMTNFKDQECFLRTALAPDVDLGELSGVDALLEQWRRYSTYFSDLQLQLQRLEEQPCGVLVATASFSFTITDEALQGVFPHLGKSGDTMRISRFLDQRLDCQCSFIFHWDDVTKRVTRLHWKMDWITPLLLVLGSLQDVSYVLEKALISPHNLIGQC